MAARIAATLSNTLRLSMLSGDEDDGFCVEPGVSLTVCLHATSELFSGGILRAVNVIDALAVAVSGRGRLGTAQ